MRLRADGTMKVRGAATLVQSAVEAQHKHFCDDHNDELRTVTPFQRLVYEAEGDESGVEDTHDTHHAPGAETEKDGRGSYFDVVRKRLADKAKRDRVSDRQRVRELHMKRKKKVRQAIDETQCVLGEQSEQTDDMEDTHTHTHTHRRKML
eukprot:GHVR01095592.1.p1 GENE.GHVR01095592.1~~GHVR01095592.1.p1  ORF type:complete len:150 (-),score=60.37 GHVR01095592.1:77-526(-)